MPVLEKYYLLANHIFRFITGKYHIVKKKKKKPNILHKEEQSLGLTICQNLALFVVIFNSQKITD